MKVAIIGGGIVGSTAAYYLSKESGLEVTLFDEGKGQATKAAAGIISPWLSKRRHKAWYRLARQGAEFYQKLVADLRQDDVLTDFYQQNGVYVLKKDEQRLQELYELALNRRQDAPLMGEVSLLSEEDVAQTFPGLVGFHQLVAVSGGARVDGALLLERLHQASQITTFSKKVSLTVTQQGYEVDGQLFDQVILATGAWLGQLLEPLGYSVDVRPQKGQLRDYQTTAHTDDYPVVMPEGEWDLIPFTKGKISLGATHENDQAWDLTIDQSKLDQLEKEALAQYPLLSEAKVTNERVGTRAYTSDFAPFFGSLPHHKGIYVASGLGASGLTTGPLIGYTLAQLVAEKLTTLTVADYPVERYVT